MALPLLVIAICYFSDPMAGGGGPKGTLVYGNNQSGGTDGFGTGANPPFPCVHGLDLSKNIWNGTTLTATGGGMGYSRMTPSGTYVQLAIRYFSASQGGINFWYGTAYDSTRNAMHMAATPTHSVISVWQIARSFLCSWRSRGLCN